MHALSLHPLLHGISMVLPELKSHLSRVLLSLQVSVWHRSEELSDEFSLQAQNESAQKMMAYKGKCLFFMEMLLNWQ